MYLKIFRKCGMTLLLFHLILASFLITGCIELGPQSLHSSSVGVPVLQPGDWSGQLRMDIDPQLRSDLFSLRGDAILAANGTLPYLLLNATLLQGKATVASTKYLLLKLEPNRDYSFEIAKNVHLQPGEYICTLEASGPGGILASESRRCSLEDEQEDHISSETSSGILLSPSEARALYAVRSLYGSESIEKEAQRESPSGEEVEREERENAQQEDESSVTRETGGEEESEGEIEPEKDMKSSSFSSGPELFGEEEQQEDRGEAEAAAAVKGEGSRSEVELEGGDTADADMNESDNGMDSLSGETAALDTQLEGTEEEPEEQFVGSSTSKKYHLPDCRYAQKIKPENRITFQSAEEAKSQGYAPCKSCHP